MRAKTRPDSLKMHRQFDRKVVGKDWSPWQQQREERTKSARIFVDNNQGEKRWARQWARIRVLHGKGQLTAQVSKLWGANQENLGKRIEAVKEKMEQL